MKSIDTGDPTLGWAEIRPDWAFAKEAGTWEIQYHCGSRPLSAGSRIRIYPPFTYDASHNSMIRWTLGSLSAQSDADIDISLKIVDTFREKVPDLPFQVTYNTEVVEITIESGELVGGESVTVVMGDQRNGGEPAIAQWMSGPDMPFPVAVDCEGNGEFVRIGRYPIIPVLGSKPDRLVCIAPSTVSVGEEFGLRVRAEDAHTNISEIYQSPLEIEREEGVSGPSECAIRPYHRGQTMVPGFSLRKRGTYRGRVSEERFETLSSPVSTEFTEPGERIFWGEIHAHSELSDGVGSENRYYEFARDEAWLDFSAIADHGGGREWWPSCVEAAEKYNEPGRFVTLVGYEWAWGDGHGCVYSIDLNLPVVSLAGREEIFELVREGRALMIPHHTNDPLVKTAALFRWDDFDKDLIQVAEICQVRGSFEKDELGGHVQFGGFGCSIQDGLSKGFRFGFTGGTDNHAGRAGSPMYSGFCSEVRKGSGETCRLDRMELNRANCGLTAVFTPALTREAIFQALRQRRCYATTGARILLNFRVGDLSMGEEGTVQPPPKIYVRIAATAPLESITIVRNNQDVHTVPGEGLDQEVVWEDSEVSPGCWYYVRVVQSDGQIAWASPIWCD